MEGALGGLLVSPSTEKRTSFNIRSGYLGFCFRQKLLRLELPQTSGRPLSMLNLFLLCGMIAVAVISSQISDFLIFSQ